MTSRIRTALAAALILAAAPALAIFAPPAASAATQVAPGRGRLSVDVWINKDEGGIFNSGEKMQVYFRASADAYVLLYNIDTEGYIHLIYPFRPGDPVHVQGGETYRVPSRHDPYDLVAEGPEGVEYVVALASPVPFVDLPWYLAPGLSDESRDRGSSDVDDDLEDGVVVGDPFVGMERLHRRIVPRGQEERVATADTYFYIERRVEYPRYVCADCHHRTYWFDPYVDVCNVIEIRIDATWARYVPLRVGSARPRYYYQVRSAAPDRYRAWKERWSSLDGSAQLRTKFVLDREVRDRRLRDGSQRRQNPPEFKDLRRYRPGRFWQGRDEVIPLRERRERVLEKIRERTNDRSKPDERGRQGNQGNRGNDARERRDRDRQDRTQPPPVVREREERRQQEQDRR
ncbi:MAG TPA: DUF4384 domain-containing protein, partial [Candidatus Eisenbacteria bacterium]